MHEPERNREFLILKPGTVFKGIPGRIYTPIEYIRLKFNNNTIYLVNSNKTHKSHILLNFILNPEILKRANLNQYEFLEDYMHIPRDVYASFEENYIEKRKELTEKLYNALTEEQKIYYEINS